MASEYKEEINRLFANEKDIWYRQKLEEYDDMKDKEVHAEYAELMGYEYVANKNGEGQFRKLNDSGTWETFEVSDETMREALADKAAYKAAEASLNTFISEMNAFTGILGGNVNGENIYKNAEK